MYNNGVNIIHPRRRSVALPLCMVPSCEVRAHRIVTSVNAFPEAALTNGFLGSVPSICNRPARSCRPWVFERPVWQD